MCMPDARDPLELELESCELPCGAGVEPKSSRGAASALTESVCLQEGSTGDMDLGAQSLLFSIRGTLLSMIQRI